MYIHSDKEAWKEFEKIKEFREQQEHVKKKMRTLLFTTPSPKPVEIKKQKLERKTTEILSTSLSNIPFPKPVEIQKQNSKRKTTESLNEEESFVVSQNASQEIKKSAVMEEKKDIFQEIEPTQPSVVVVSSAITTFRPSTTTASMISGPSTEMPIIETFEPTMGPIMTTSSTMMEKTTVATFLDAEMANEKQEVRQANILSTNHILTKVATKDHQWKPEWAILIALICGFSGSFGLVWIFWCIMKSRKQCTQDLNQVGKLEI